MNQPEIKDSITFRNFVKSNGNPKLTTNEIVDTETGELKQVKSLYFPQSNLFVGFSRKLGELTYSQMVQKFDDLQVVLRENGRYSLCNKGVIEGQDLDFSNL